jgi:hypothetical protein
MLVSVLGLLMQCRMEPFGAWSWALTGCEQALMSWWSMPWRARDSGKSLLCLWSYWQETCIYQFLSPGVTQRLICPGGLRARVHTLSQPDPDSLHLPGHHLLPPGLKQGFLVDSMVVLALYLKLRIQEPETRGNLGQGTQLFQEMLVWQMKRWQDSLISRPLSSSHKSLSLPLSPQAIEGARQNTG